MKAVSDCTFVIHNAHPNPYVKRALNEAETILPTEKGTRLMLEACEFHKVKRLIVTLSLYCCIGDLWKDEKG